MLKIYGWAKHILTRDQIKLTRNIQVIITIVIKFEINNIND